MSDTPKATMVDDLKVKKGPWDKLRGWLRRRREFRIEDILRAAKKGRLDQVLTLHYTIYTDPCWREKLQLCRDLKEMGYLQANFRNDSDGKTPVFLEGPARITITGRDYLSRIEQNKPWRRVLMWMLAFVIGLLSSSVVKWLDLFIEAYTREQGLK